MSTPKYEVELRDGYTISGETMEDLLQSMEYELDSCQERASWLTDLLSDDPESAQIEEALI